MSAASPPSLPARVRRPREFSWPLLAVLLPCLVLSTLSAAPGARGAAGYPSATPGAASLKFHEALGPRSHLPTYEASINTTDRTMAENIGLTGFVTLPTGDLVPGENWSFLLADPVNQTETAGLGLVGSEGAGGPLWYAEYFVWNDQGRPANVTVVNRTNTFEAGATVGLDLTWSSGSWWNFTADGAAVNGTGDGVNATVDLGSNVSVAFSPSAPFVTSPTFVILGNTTALPARLLLSPILGFFTPPTAVPTLSEPDNGIWWSSTSGWQAAGEDQTSTLEMWQVELGPGCPQAPSNGTWLWGIGGPSVTPRGNVSTGGAAANNTGFGVEVDLNASSYGPSASSFQVTAWEVAAPGDLLGVGAWVNAPGDVTIPYYVQDLDGLTETYVADQSEPIDNVPLLLQAFDTGEGNWNFTVNGMLLQGAEGGPAAGNLTLGFDVIPNGSLTFTTFASVGSVGAGSALDVEATFLLNLSGNWTAPTAGWVGNSSASAVEGNLQDPFLVPDQVVWSPGLPALPVGTLLWNGSGYVPVQLAWSGVPQDVTSYENVTAVLWVNGTTGPLERAEAVLQLPSGVTSGVANPLGPGVFEYDLAFPSGEGGSTPLSVGAYATAPGYLPNTTFASTLLVSGELSVSAVVEATELAPGTSALVVVWVNGSAGAGPQGDVALQATSALGGTLVPIAGAPGPGVWYFDYTAPPTVGTSTDTLEFTASEPGFRASEGEVDVLVVPPGLELAVTPLGGQILSGQPVTLEAWVNTTGGTPLTGAVFVAGFPELGENGVSAPSSAPGVYEFEVPTPLVPLNESAEVRVVVSVLGYQQGVTLVEVPLVLGVLGLAWSVAPAVQGVYPITVTVTLEGAPVSGALATLVSSGGTLLENLLATGETGLAEFTWIPPSGGSGAYTFNLSVSYPGAIAPSIHFVVVVPATSSSTLVSPTGLLLLVLGPASVLLAFLLLWAYGRRKAGPPRPSLHVTPPGKPPVPPDAPPASEAAASGTGSWVPVESATKEVEPPSGSGAAPATIVEPPSVDEAPIPSPPEGPGGAP